MRARPCCQPCGSVLVLVVDLFGKFETGSGARPSVPLATVRFSGAHGLNFELGDGATCCFPGQAGVLGSPAAQGLGR